MKADKYFILLQKFLSKKSSKEENKELAEWIDSEKGHDCFDAYSKAAWDDAPAEMDADIKKRMWSAMTGKMNKVKRRDSLFTKFSRVYRVAAAILLPVCIGVTILALNVVRKNAASEMSEITVERGQKASVVLPDGTRAWLNSASKLAYNRDFNRKERRIELEGEAYFEVAKNPAKKFTVHCNGLNIEALGTTFDVKGYQADESVTVALMEGSVKVYDTSEEGVYMSPSQYLSFNKNEHSFFKREIADSREIDFWRKNILYFKSARLVDIAKTLERMYGIEILFESEELKQIPFSGSIRNNSLTNVFHIISLTYPLDYELGRDTVVIKETNL